MAIAACGRCYHDRGQVVPISVLIGVDRKRIMYCAFCDEERHEGGMRVRVHISPDIGKGDRENVLNIHHIVAV